jgi:hypothetical protein
LSEKCGIINTTRGTSLRLSLLKPLAQNFNVFKIFALELYRSWGDYFFAIVIMTANMIKANKKSYKVITSPPFCPFLRKNKEPKAKGDFSNNRREALLVGFGKILNNDILA